MTALQSLSPAEASRRYRWIPWCFLAAFGVVLIANGTLLYFATRQPVGLVIEKPYENGIAYNKILAAGRAQAKLGWEAQVIASDFNAAEGRARVQVRLTDSQGPLVADVVQLTLTRPLEGTRLPTVSLPVESGFAQTTLSGLLPGQWAARLVIHRGDTQAVIEQRIILK